MKFSNIFLLICHSFPTLIYIVRSESHSANCDDLDDVSDETCSAKANLGNNKNQPNIIFILADDLGYTDVQYNNASVITPTILRMAKEGIKLNQNYMQSWCTPSRYALMTGMYPIHIGKQDSSKSKRYLEPTGISVNYKLLPEKLQDLGYDTHLVGKWDLGYCHESYTPTKRGFNSFYGFWGGMNDHYTKVRYGVTDWKDGLENTPTFPDQHSSFLFMDRVKSILDTKTSKSNRNPLFLLFATPLPHDPFQAPKKYYDMYPNIENKLVRNRNGLISMLDDTIANLTQMIEDAGMSENTIFIFSSDNGPFQRLPNGPNEDDRLGKFRGAKSDDTLEGGTRVPGFIKSPLLSKSFESDSLIHVTDWYPTILRMAGLSSEDTDTLKFDGVDQYDTFFNPEDENEGPRKTMVYNIDKRNDIPVGAVRKGWWKYAQEFSDGVFERALYDLKNDPTEKHNLISQNKEKGDELTEFFLREAASMVAKDLPSSCPCPDSQPPCDVITLKTGRPTDCTTCINADESNSIKSGWCDIVTKSCIF